MKYGYPTGADPQALYAFASRLVNDLNRTEGEAKGDTGAIGPTGPQGIAGPAGAAGSGSAGVSSFNTRAGAVSLSGADVNTAIGASGGTANFYRQDGTFAAPPSGGSGYTVRTETLSYTETATSGEKIGRVSGTMTVTLPTAVGNTAILHFKLIAAGTVTIDGAGAETIDGALTATLAAVNNTISLYSDNANWMII